MANTSSHTSDKNKKTTERHFTPEQTRKTGEPHAAVVTIRKDRDEVFAFVTDLRNFPKFSDSVLAADGARDNCTWTLRVLLKKETVTAAFEHDTAGKEFAWTLTHTDGSREICCARFYDGPREGTTIVTMEFGDPRQPGRIKGALELLFGADAKAEATRNLRRLKAFLETGEIATITGQPSGREGATH